MTGDANDDTPRTVKVRVAVAVDAEGTWRAFGGSGISDAWARREAILRVSDLSSTYWLTAELPVPTAREVAAGVERAEADESTEGD